MRKQKCRESGWTEKYPDTLQTNISICNVIVLVLERDVVGTKHNNLFRMSKYSLLICNCNNLKPSGNGRIH